MKPVEGLIAKVADGVWIGNAFVSPSIVKADAVIKLDNSVNVAGELDCFNYALPDSELLSEECPKVITKLKTICEDIHELRGVGRNVIIQCADGKNKSALVAGFYLTRYLGQKGDVVVNQLSTVYFSPEQVIEDRFERDRTLKIRNGEAVEPLSQEDLKKQEARRTRQVLSNLSFRKIVQTIM